MYVTLYGRSFQIWNRKKKKRASLSQKLRQFNTCWHETDCPSHSPNPKRQTKTHDTVRDTAALPLIYDMHTQHMAQHQWYIFPLVCGHRLIEIPKDWMFQPPSVIHISTGLWSQTDWNPQRLIVSTSIRTLVRLKYNSGGLVSSFSMMLWTSPAAIVFPPNSSIRLAQRIEVLTSASGPQGHLRHVLAEVNGHV